MARLDGSAQSIPEDDCYADLNMPNDARSPGAGRRSSVRGGDGKPNKGLRDSHHHENPCCRRSHDAGSFACERPRDEGYAVDITFDGDEALKLAIANPYDALILDMMLPGKDGWTILQTLRKQNVKSPVLCLTAQDGTEDKIRGLNLGR